MKLITLNQVKMLKSHDMGFLSAILNLAPAFKYKGHNTCPNAGQCKGLCLQMAGRNRFDEAVAARERRTKLYYDNPVEFYRLLLADIEALQRKAKRENLIPTVRLNGLSDIAFEDDIVPNTRVNIFDVFNEVQFIDYTKRYTRMFKSLPSNYHLTYSINEQTPPGIVDRVYSETRFNCAAVFYPTIPSEFDITTPADNFCARFMPVVSGDDHDLRHLDPHGKIIGLRYKLTFHPKTGKGVKPKKSGFVILN